MLRQPPLIKKGEFLKIGMLFFSFSVLMFLTRGNPFEMTFLQWSWVAPSWVSSMVDTFQLAMSVVAALVSIACLAGIGFTKQVSELVGLIKNNQIGVFFYWLISGLCFLGSWLKAFVGAESQNNPPFYYFVLLGGLLLLAMTFGIPPANEANSSPANNIGDLLKTLNKYFWPFGNHSCTNCGFFAWQISQDDVEGRIKTEECNLIWRKRIQNDNDLGPLHDYETQEDIIPICYKGQWVFSKDMKTGSVKYREYVNVDNIVQTRKCIYYTVYEPGCSPDEHKELRRQAQTDRKIVVATLLGGALGAIGAIAAQLLYVLAIKGI